MISLPCFAIQSPFFLNFRVLHTSESHSPTYTEGDFESQVVVAVQQIFVDILDGTPAGFLITVGSVAVATHHLQVAVKHSIHHSVRHFDDLKILIVNVKLADMLTWKY